MNRYSKALKQLKSTNIDSKIKKLEETPTNNTKGVYSLNPQVHSQNTRMSGEKQKCFFSLYCTFELLYFILFCLIILLFELKSLNDFTLSGVLYITIMILIYIMNVIHLFH